MRTGRIPVSLVLLSVAAMGAARAEPQLLTVEGSGLLELLGESRLRIESVTGQVRVVAGEPGELRFVSTRTSKAAEDLPIELWSDGSSLTIRASEGAEEVPRTLWVSVPESVSLQAVLREATVVLDGIADAAVEGVKLDVVAQRLSGSLHAELQGGRLRAGEVAGDLTLAGTGYAAEVSGVGGGCDVRATGGNIALEDIDGPVEGSIAETRFVVEMAEGGLRLEADGGEIEISKASGGGDLRLSRATLKLEKSQGEIPIVTDAVVWLTDNEAAITVESYGGAVRGAGQRGPLEIRTHDADVILEQVGAPLRVEGDRLRVNVKGVAKESSFTLTASDLVVEQAAGAVTVRSDFGDVTVHGPIGAVDVESRRGNVAVTDAQGPVQVEADGERVEVSWVTLPRDEDSRIQNEGGDVFVQLPGSGSCRLEAMASHGRIESDRDDVRVADDGRHAIGMINRGRRPVLRVECWGDLYLLSRGSAASTRGD